MAENATIARPYARAAFEYAQQSQALARWSEILRVAAQVVIDERVASLLNNPRIDEAELASLVLDLAAPSADEHVRGFMRVLAQNRRLDLLPEVAAQYEALRADVENTANVSIVSAVPLTAEQRQKFADALKVRLGRTVNIQCEVDPELLGGAIVRAGDFMIDGSLRGRLARLGEAMTN